MTPDTAAFLRDLLGTCLGAGLGLAGAMWWDRRKDREANRTIRMRAVAALLTELDGTTKSLGVPALEMSEQEGGAVAIDMNVPFLLDSAFRTAVSSNALGWLPAEAQGTLSSFYEHLRITRLAVDQLVTAYSGGGDVKAQVSRMQSAANYLAGHSAMLLGNLCTSDMASAASRNRLM